MGSGKWDQTRYLINVHGVEIVFGVFPVEPDPDVDIFRVSGTTMKGQGVAADNQVRDYQATSAN